MHESGQISPVSVPGTPVRALTRTETFAAALSPFSADGRKRRRMKCLTRALYGSLFPTLDEFRKKSWTAALLAVIAVPAIFCLVLTLPVVDEEAEAATASDLHEKGPIHLPEGDDEDEEEQYRASKKQESRLRGEHIAHQLHSPAAMHHHQRDNYFDVDSMDARELDRSLRQLSRDSEEGKPLSAHHRIDSQLPSPPASPLSDEEQTRADRLVSRCLTGIQCTIAPIFCVAALTSDDPNVWYFLASIGTGLVLGLLSQFIVMKWPQGRVILCVIGFVVSMVWLLTIVNEVVGVLQAVGHVFGLSDSILGVTIFALGNSTADLVANLTIASMGYPQMAISACFGSPLLNVLLGVGVSGSYYIHTSGQSYHIHFDPTLLATCVGLIVVLLANLILIPMNDYVMTKKYGIFLICFYLILVAINVIIEIKY